MDTGAFAQNQEMSNTDTPCMGAGCAGASPDVSAFTNVRVNPNLPTLEEIASYNLMNPYQKERQRQQLQNAGNSPLQDYAEENRNAMWPPLTNIWQNANGTQGTQTQSSAVAQSGATGGSLAPITSMTQPQSIPAESTFQYMNGFLRTPGGASCARWISWSGPTALLHAPGFSWPLGQILSSSTRRKQMISLPVILITSSSSVSIINRKWKNRERPKLRGGYDIVRR